jgi:diacylglycerol kinase (ATP)
LFALLIKPTVLKTARGRRVIAAIHELGAINLLGTTTSQLQSELEVLSALHDKLVVVACGGDGTVHLAVNSLPNSRTSIAVVPLGTGNDFARYLGIKNPKTGIEILRSGVLAEFDLGNISLENGVTRNFVGVASCGFDAQVNERANTYRGPTGTLKYLFALVIELSQLQARELEIRTTQETRSREAFTLIAVGNTSSYGGGMKMCPTADAQDGHLEVTYVSKVSRRLLLRVLPKVFWGGHVHHPKVRQEVCTEIEISGANFPIYADGELVGVGPATIKVRPGVLRVWQALAPQTP